MTVRFLKSEIDALPFRFADAVKEYIAAMNDHRRTVGVAAPSHHRWVEAAVSRVRYPVEEEKPDDFVEDYEIIDDTPPLWERKRNLAALVERSEEEVSNKIWPVTLRRMEQIELEDLQALELPTKADRKRIESIKAKMSNLELLRRKTAHVIATIEELDESNIGSWVFDLEA